MTDRFPLPSPKPAPNPVSGRPSIPFGGAATKGRTARRRWPIGVLSALLLWNLTGCASTSADGYVDPQDPWEPMNRHIYSFNKALDKAVIKPVAKAYDFVMPTFANRAVTNFFGNIDDLFGFGNDLLQLKFRRAAGDGARVAWNTTAGLLGLMDVATPMGLEKHEQDLGLTFARYGVGTGPYLVLPLLGPSTVRDGVGTAGRFFFGPEPYLFPKTRVRWGLTALNMVDTRAGLFQAENILQQAALDEYAFVRDAYLQRRRSLQYDGNPPLEDDEFLDEDDEDYLDDEDDDEGGSGDEGAADGTVRHKDKNPPAQAQTNAPDKQPGEHE